MWSGPQTTSDVQHKKEYMTAFGSHVIPEDAAPGRRLLFAAGARREARIRREHERARESAVAAQLSPPASGAGRPSSGGHREVDVPHFAPPADPPPVRAPARHVVLHKFGRPRPSGLGPREAVESVIRPATRDPAALLVAQKPPPALFAAACFGEALAQRNAPERCTPRAHGAARVAMPDTSLRASDSFLRTKARARESDICNSCETPSF